MMHQLTDEILESRKRKLTSQNEKIENKRPVIIKKIRNHYLCEILNNITFLKSLDFIHNAIRISPYKQSENSNESPLIFSIQNNKIQNGICTLPVDIATSSPLYDKDTLMVVGESSGYIIQCDKYLPRHDGVFKITVMWESLLLLYYFQFQSSTSDSRLNDSNVFSAFTWLKVLIDANFDKMDIFLEFLTINYAKTTKKQELPYTMIEMLDFSIGPYQSLAMDNLVQMFMLKNCDSNYIIRLYTKLTTTRQCEKLSSLISNCMMDKINHNISKNHKAIQVLMTFIISKFDNLYLIKYTFYLLQPSIIYYLNNIFTVELEANISTMISYCEVDKSIHWLLNMLELFFNALPASNKTQYYLRIQLELLGQMDQLEKIIYSYNNEIKNTTKFKTGNFNTKEIIDSLYITFHLVKVLKCPPSTPLFNKKLNSLISSVNVIFHTIIYRMNLAYDWLDGASNLSKTKWMLLKNPYLKSQLNWIEILEIIYLLRHLQEGFFPKLQIKTDKLYIPIWKVYPLNKTITVDLFHGINPLYLKDLTFESDANLLISTDDQSHFISINTKKNIKIINSNPITISNLSNYNVNESFSNLFTSDSLEMINLIYMNMNTNSMDFKDNLSFYRQNDLIKVETIKLKLYNDWNNFDTEEENIDLDNIERENIIYSSLFICKIIIEYRHSVKCLLNFSFSGEMGKGPGVNLEWLQTVSKELFKTHWSHIPSHPRLLLPKELNENEEVEIYQLTGIVIALSLVNRDFILESWVPPFIFNRLLCQTIDSLYAESIPFSKEETIDCLLGWISVYLPENFNSCFYIITSDVTNLELEYDFDNGLGIVSVDNMNKCAYIKRVMHGLLFNPYENAFKHLLEGFSAIIRLNTNYSQSEFAYLNSLSFSPEYTNIFCCSNDIDVNRWRNNCNIVYEENTQAFDNVQVIDDFWSIVENLSSTLKKKLLGFWASIDSLPLETKRFSLYILDYQPLETIKTRLPTASTCFSRLNISPCKNKNDLERVLLLALDYGSTSFHLI